ncbi:MAG TPA: hypothetical protein VG796_11530 [Verrucomicrobiales bacterium]|jgi:hypothetical protein|nr:hypothetical protein [Verrucomicrobiales bacterium]
MNKHTDSKPRLLIGLACFLAVPAFACPPVLYTTIAHWNSGTRSNTQAVADASDGSLKLVDVGEVETLPILWPANAAEATVTKFDGNVNKEIGRYRTWFPTPGNTDPWNGAAPSRSAVDASGNVYVVNRHLNFNSPTSGRPISVLKILTSDVGAVDRNGDGIINTAVDTNSNGVVDGAEILPVIDDGGFGGGGIAGNGIPELAEFRDERIRWIVQVPGSVNATGRSCAIDPSGNLWVGGYHALAYWKLSSATGALLAGPVPTTGGHRPYGAVIDSRGMLWSAGWDSGSVGQLNTNTNTWVATRTQPFDWVYGIALDDSLKRVYTGNGQPYDVLAPIDGAPVFTNLSLGTNTFGISTTAGGGGNLDILVHGSNPGFPGSAGGFKSSMYGATRFRNDHSVIWSSGAQPGGVEGQSRGIVPDANGDIFTANLDTNNVSKYRGSDGAHLGVFPIGLRPYSYSDFTGSSFLQTNLSGTWTIQHADTARGNKNPAVSWHATGPGSVLVEVAGSNTSGSPGPFVAVSNGGSAPAVSGKYITVRVTLQAASQVSPTLHDLTLNTCPQIGDFNNDCCNDMADYNLMRAAYNARSTDPKWDVNGDGVFNINDLRKEVLLFCYPNGAECDCCGDA